LNDSGRASADGVVVRLPRSGAIAGRVTDRFGEPAAGVQMQLFAQGPDRSKLGAIRKRTNTDDLGEYRFGGLEEGAYIVSAATLLIDSPGPVDRRALYYPGVPTSADAQVFDLHPGEEKFGVDFAGINLQLPDASLIPQLQARIAPNGQL